MRAFAALYEALDTSTKTNDKLAALKRYFEQADAESAAWATYFLIGNKLKEPDLTVRLSLLPIRKYVAHAADSASACSK